MAACITSAFYLNHQHRAVSRVLTENADSTGADKRLETTLDNLVPLLRGDHSQHIPLTSELIRRHLKANQELDDVLRHANTEEEQTLVDQVEQSWRRYWEAWSKRALKQPQELVQFDRQLADQLSDDVLMNCSRLLDYNVRQVNESNSRNRLIVDRLTTGLLAVGVGAPLAGLLLGYAMARRMHQSIYQLSVRIRDAAGRLNGKLRPVTIEGDGDLSATNEHMQGIIEEIERVFKRLHQSEHEVLRSEQLAAVGQVAAGVAHELRNPLTSVKMLVQTGLEGEPAPGLAAEDLTIIEHEVRRMEACIQTFLDFARPPAAERRRTDLVAVIRRAVALVEGRARRQNVRIQIEAPQHPVELLIDGEQIHQVLINLMLNALDAMPRGGDLRLKVLPIEGNPPRIAVRIADSGPGVADAILARLFEPFVSGKETGLGLGLSISRRLIEAHGGSITGENASEGGAVFTFTLPVAK